MMLHWRGWGASVFLLFVFWIFVGIGLAIGLEPYIPDKHRATIIIEWGFAGLFALHALSVWVIVRYRRSRAPRSLAPSVVVAEPTLTDEFMFIRLDFWPYILFAVFLLFAGAAALGYSLFD